MPRWAWQQRRRPESGQRKPFAILNGEQKVWNFFYPRLFLGDTLTARDELLPVPLPKNGICNSIVFEREKREDNQILCLKVSGRLSLFCPNTESPKPVIPRLGADTGL